MGIDISTNKKKGIPIFSPFKGKIVRVKDSWKGYGRTIYLKNKKGYIYAFVHLNDFREDIEKIVYLKKKENKKNEISLFINIKIDSAEIVAFSGNSGTKTPHIHLEIRKGFDEVINPLYILNVKDTIRPVIKKIKIYPLFNSKLFGSYIPREFKRPFPDTVFITSDFWLWISAFDYQSKNSDKIAVYKITISIFDSVICELKFDSINYKNNYIARALYTKTDNFFSTSYIHPINMENSPWKGHTFISPKKKKFLLKIKAFDFKGNYDEVKIWVKRETKIRKIKNKSIYFVLDGIIFKENEKEKKILLKPGNYGRIKDFIYVFPLPEKSYKVKLKNFEIKIPKYSQFFPYPLFFKEKYDTLFIYSAKVPLKNPLKIKIKNKKKEEIILKFNEFSHKEELFSPDTVFYTYSWGKFWKKTDTVKPFIKAKKTYYINKNKNFEVRFYVSDNYGVKDINFYINNEWEPVLYNPNTFEARVKVMREIKEKNLNFKIIVHDYSDNMKEFKGEIICKF